MDYVFEIMIPMGTKVSGIKFKVPVYEWDGVAYPQGPEEARFHSFKLKKTDPPGYLLRRLPYSMGRIKWQCLEIVEGLDELREGLWLLKNDDFRHLENEINEKSNRLFELLRIIIGDKPAWFVSYMPNYDDDFEKVIEGDMNIVHQEILHSLGVESKAFIIWNSPGEQILPKGCLGSLRYIFTGRIK